MSKVARGTEAAMSDNYDATLCLGSKMVSNSKVMCGLGLREKKQVDFVVAKNEERVRSGESLQHEVNFSWQKRMN